MKPAPRNVAVAVAAASAAMPLRFASIIGEADQVLIVTVSPSYSPFAIVDSSALARVSTTETQASDGDTLSPSGPPRKKVRHRELVLTDSTNLDGADAASRAPISKAAVPTMESKSKSNGTKTKSSKASVM
ncbi:hypothetical protein PC116_g5449 [Phytophthora cactorum]|uniref:Uncharacterized protein n=1 Tax=Phytophthora cactorum TaxID=29920 RepID=A0A329R7N5_9STRA|nr:hypothetical protein Pcac1_g13235 [Phytophthora cactorum]KAG2799417.1 hypothetical protein PC112_g20907 [Phytophthora cactorum]KAG2875783.1 hypothetical protein PC114_g24533 [Phytophthora cactorum]KAG2880070.1 hypothetical protein PC117_g26654 [Phytophthora cactorum]KAG2961620.1 hypothetical protein PC118_g21861 [Phytophthora cactorum]